MSAYIVKDGTGNRVGTVFKFVGNSPARRWVAYRMVEGAREVKMAFRSLNAASEWLLKAAPDAWQDPALDPSAVGFTEQTAPVVTQPASGGSKRRVG